MRPSRPRCRVERNAPGAQQLRTTVRTADEPPVTEEPGLERRTPADDLDLPPALDTRPAGIAADDEDEDEELSRTTPADGRAELGSSSDDEEGDAEDRTASPSVNQESADRAPSAATTEPDDTSEDGGEDSATASA